MSTQSDFDINTNVQEYFALEHATNIGLAKFQFTGIACIIL